MRESLRARKDLRLSEHPTPAELVKFGTEMPTGSFWRMARHLLQGCPTCKTLLVAHYGSMLASNPEPLDLDRVLSEFRLHHRYLRREEIHQRRAAAFLDGGDGWEALINSSDIPLRGLGVLKALLDRSWAVRFENHKEMLGISRIA